MPVAGVTFDLWQTLLIDSQELGGARMNARIDGAARTLRQAEERFSRDHIVEAYRQCSLACQEIRAQERDLSFMEQVDTFIRHIDPGLSERLPEVVVKRIAAAYADSLFSAPPPPHPQAVGVLRRVKEMGHRVGLISNTGMTPGTTFRLYMEQIGLLKYFDVLTFSDEVGVSKPAQEIFLGTARELGLPPEQLVHVGDDIVNDQLGARRAGMKTIWIYGGQEAHEGVMPDVVVTSLGEVPSAVEGIALGSV